MMFSLKKGMIACNPSLAHVNELKEEKYETICFTLTVGSSIFVIILRDFNWLFVFSFVLFASIGM